MGRLGETTEKMTTFPTWDKLPMIKTGGRPPYPAWHVEALRGNPFLRFMLPLWDPTGCSRDQEKAWSNIVLLYGLHMSDQLYRKTGVNMVKIRFSKWWTPFWLVEVEAETNRIHQASWKTRRFASQGSQPAPRPAISCSGRSKAWEGKVRFVVDHSGFQPLL